MLCRLDPLGQSNTQSVADGKPCLDECLPVGRSQRLDPTLPLRLLDLANHATASRLVKTLLSHLIGRRTDEYDFLHVALPARGLVRR